MCGEVYSAKLAIDFFSIGGDVCQRIYNVFYYDLFLAVKCKFEFAFILLFLKFSYLSFSFLFYFFRGWGCCKVIKSSHKTTTTK